MLVKIWLRLVLVWSYDHNLMINKYICHQHLILRQNLKRSFFYGCLLGTKVPRGYYSNIKSLVSIKNLKLMGLKSHDCHVLMQDILPVDIYKKMLDKSSLIFVYSSKLFVGKKFILIGWMT